MKSPKIDTAKNKPYYTSSLKDLAKIRLSEILTHLQSVIFAKISRREKFPIYGMNISARVFIKHIASVKHLIIMMLKCFYRLEV